MGRSRSRSRGDGGADAQKIQALVDERNDARRERDWDRADKLRDELREMGVSFNDTNGTWTGPGGLSGQTGHAKGAGKGSKGRDRSDDRGRDDRRGGGGRYDSPRRQRYESPPRGRGRRDDSRRPPPRRRDDSRGRGGGYGDRRGGDRGYDDRGRDDSRPRGRY
mmetsp:Transcript_64158/g.101780  ORF Transcript_64158/g.101780 Transcript_64158/m.101780 type:complete len:164 (-) Transcript_64158:193-684(-)